MNLEQQARQSTARLKEQAPISHLTHVWDMENDRFDEVLAAYRENIRLIHEWWNELDNECHAFMNGYIARCYLTTRKALPAA